VLRLRGAIKGGLTAAVDPVIQGIGQAGKTVADEVGDHLQKQIADAKTFPRRRSPASRSPSSATVILKPGQWLGRAALMACVVEYQQGLVEGASDFYVVH
jgi:hypothetical protein